MRLIRLGGGARAGAPRTKAAALARHRRNRVKIDRFIRSALEVDVDPSQGAASQANLLHNSAEWVHSGNATLYVLTPTYDSHLRPSVPATKMAFFDTRVDYQTDGATYDDTLNSARCGAR